MKPTIQIRGKVEKIIPATPTRPEIAQIFLTCADETFTELRVKNNFEGVTGDSVRLKQGAEVVISVELPS
jgi:hypothetical protein